MTIVKPIARPIVEDIVKNIIVSDQILSGYTLTVNTSNPGSANDRFIMPTVAPASGGLYDATTTVDWDDGTVDTNMATFDDARWTHDFVGGPGIFTVRVTGTFRGFRFNSSGDRRKITDISQWGQLQLTNNGGHFSGCSNLDISATDVLDLTGLTTLFGLFSGCSSLTDVPSLEDWDFLLILNIASMFSFCPLFNGTVEGMSIDNVTNMQETFQFCSSFNQPVEGLPTGSVRIFQNTFNFCASFNQPVNGLDTSSAINMLGMFQTAIAFNQPISTFNTGGIANFNAFLRTTSFDQDLSTLDFSSATSMVNFLQNVALSTANYNAFLLSLDAQSVQSSVSFSGGDSTFDSARIAVTSLTRSGNVVTATTAFPHGLVTSDRMVIFGAQQAGYRRVEPITFVSPTVFTYIIPGTPVTPATGTITCELALPAIARRSLQQNDGWTIVDGGTLSGFISEWVTTNTGTSNNDQITIPTRSGGTYDETTTVNWGDGNVDTNMDTFDDPRWTHTYSSSGTYTVTIFGTMIGFNFANGNDRLKITKIGAWGNLQLGQGNAHLRGAANLVILATDTLVVGSSSLQNSFRGMTSLTSIPNIDTWDLSGTSIIASMLDGSTSFDQDLGDMDMSAVTLAFDFLRSVTMSTANWSNTLIGWDAQSVQNNVSISGGNSTYDSTIISVTSITRSGSTASVTTSLAHGLSNGQRMFIAGSDQSEYNVVAAVSNVGATTFDYTVSGTPVTPATGTITVEVEEAAVSRMTLIDVHGWTISDGGGV